MKRFVLVLAVVAMMAMIVVAMAAPAMARGNICPRTYHLPLGGTTVEECIQGRGGGR